MGVAAPGAAWGARSLWGVESGLLLAVRFRLQARRAERGEEQSSALAVVAKNI